jgi:hypothetical protein
MTVSTAIQSQAFSGSMREGQAWPIVSREYWPDGVLIDGSLTSGIHGMTSVTVEVFDEQGASANVAVFTASGIVPSTVFYAVIQPADGFWTLDTGGYNFHYILLPTSFDQQGGHTYRIEVTIALHASNTVYPTWRLVFWTRCEPASGS